ncbi:hypothetical protein U3516DRAFT_734413 [Neocallimastix sp. 'constans']
MHYSLKTHTFISSFLKLRTNKLSITDEEISVSSTTSSLTKLDEILNKLKLLNGRDLLDRLTYKVNKKNFLTWENFLRIILRQYNKEINEKDLEIDEKLRFIFRCTLGTKILSNAQNISLNGYGIQSISEFIKNIEINFNELEILIIKTSDIIYKSQRLEKRRQSIGTILSRVFSTEIKHTNRNKNNKYENNTNKNSYIGHNQKKNKYKNKFKSNNYQKRKTIDMSKMICLFF